MAGEALTGKLKRQALLHYIDASFGGDTPIWFLIGKDIDSMAVELNPETEQKTNILGETSTTDNGYKPSMSADPYYANPSDSIYPKLKDITMNRLTGDSCKTKVLEVVVDTAGEPYDAWTEDVIVKPKSYGGGTEGVAIPFDVNFDGNRQQGTVTMQEKVPTFTAGTAASTDDE